MTTRAARWLALLAASLLSPLAVAAPTAANISLTVDTRCNKYTGLIDQDNGVVRWLGIRYAAPPVGDLRFAPPQDPSCADGVQLANEHGKLCLATNANPSDPSTSEDCLFLDVYSPAGATRRSKLPVFVFLQGGGFNSLSNPNLDGTGLIKASGHNMVFVTFNYRVGPYGFITNGDGDDIKPNNGLRDQRKALEWVQKYIRFFGGDPDHVVLGGDSAGAASISLQMVAYGGRDTGLFHAAAAESVSFATVLTVAESQYQYDNFSLAAGCATGAGAGAGSSLACLRSKSAQTLQAANTGSAYPGAPHKPIYPWNPVIDDDLLTDVTYKLFAEGKFVKVPMIVGDDTNEGTIFTPRTASTQGESDDFLLSQFPYLTHPQLAKIASLYPNPDADLCPASGCYWRQVADVYGDMRYLCPGLYISSALREYGVSAGSWSYRWNVEDPDQVRQGLGVPHTVELSAVFGPDYVSGSPPASYRPGGVNAAAVPVVQAYWTSFIRSFDPNRYRLPGSARWDTWNPAAKNRLLFSTGGGTEMENVDRTTRDRCEYFYSIGVDVKQ